MHCFTVFPFLLRYLTNAEYMISSWSVASKSTLIIPNNFISIITAICFIALLINRNNDRLLPLLGQELLFPNRMNEFMDLRANFSTLPFPVVGLKNILSPPLLHLNFLTEFSYCPLENVWKPVLIPQTLSLESPFFSSLDACTFKTMVWHQRPLRTHTLTDSSKTFFRILLSLRSNETCTACRCSLLEHLLIPVIWNRVCQETPVPCGSTEH